MALHEQCVGATDEWYTPPHIFEALGCVFDTDVAHPGLPLCDWVPADRLLTSNSLQLPWEGFVWMNPPFGARNGLVPWLEKFVAHGNGVALIPDRTSAPWWQHHVPKTDLVLFVSPKIKFLNPLGKPGPSPAQGTCLLALGQIACLALKRAAPSLGVLLKP